MSTPLVENSTQVNAQRLLWAGFLAIFAAGIGLAIRSAIFGEWVAAWNFSGVQLGLIGGAGFTGFCFGIVIGGVIVDRIGYGKLIFAAFALHVLSAVVTFSASEGMSTDQAFNVLWLGTFIFALANGTLEGVSNPLVATLFPQNRTHYLNILHASWPLGLMFGALLHLFLKDQEWANWKIELGLFLIPTVAYGVLFLGQKFPKSEASDKGLSFGEMMKDVGILGAGIIGFFAFLFTKDSLGPLLQGFTGNEFFAAKGWLFISIGVGVLVTAWFGGSARWTLGTPLLAVLFITHTLVGAVELGTEGWIQNIQDTILAPGDGTKVLIWTSLLMFILRFQAHFFESKLGIKPLNLLLICAIFGAVGLVLVSHATTFWHAIAAITVYAIGKTFFWPTMLAVVGDRFPRTGAVAMSIMGGLGMMSAGLIGSVGLGYAKDRFSAEELQKKGEGIYEQYKSQDAAKGWLFFAPVQGLDGQKAKLIQEKNEAIKAQALAKEKGEPVTEVIELTADEKAVFDANIEGNRKMLRADAFIPGIMAVIYLLLLFYFKAIGGYKPLTVEDQQKADLAS